MKVEISELLANSAAYQTKQRKVLALLRDSNNSAISREILRGVVWPDARYEPKGWKNSLRMLCSNANKNYSAKIVAVKDGCFAGYQIRPHASV